MHSHATPAGALQNGEDDVFLEKARSSGHIVHHRRFHVADLFKAAGKSSDHIDMTHSHVQRASAWKTLFWGTHNIRLE